jgi:hypothetical protein
MDWTQPNVCVDDNMAVTGNANTPADERLLQMSRWSVPRNVRDVVAVASDDKGKIFPTTRLPGKLLINQRIEWINDSPLPVDLLITLTRNWREILTSAPNAIQFRDRYTRTLDRDPDEPITTAMFNSQSGIALDTGTNSVAEPNPGRLWRWQGTASASEIVWGIEPGQTFKLWYQCYVWTPPMFSDNANKNSPQHNAKAFSSRIQCEAYPTQGSLVMG